MATVTVWRQAKDCRQVCAGPARQVEQVLVATAVPDRYTASDGDLEAAETDCLLQARFDELAAALFENRK